MFTTVFINCALNQLEIQASKTGLNKKFLIESIENGNFSISINILTSY